MAGGTCTPSWCGRNVFCAFGIIFISLCVGLCGVKGQYTPDWASLDARPMPPWFDDVKFGIFIHWGIFSVPAYAPESMGGAEWYAQRLYTGENYTVDFHKAHYPPNFTYPEFESMFHAELWDPQEWAQLFVDAGAKFVVFTSKHCDGWCNWKSPSPVKWNYNSVDVGPKRDIVGNLTAAVKAAGIRMGLYYCNIEWGNPLLPWDYWDGPVPYSGQETYVNEVWLTELKDLVMKYEPDVLNADYTILLNSTQLQAPEFLAWLFNESPVKETVVIDDRWGTDALCKHGGYLTCFDNYNPATLLPKKWVDERTIGLSWGLNRMETALDYKTSAELIAIFIQNVALGGNLLLNVGPTADGRIIPIQEERLRDIGTWLGVNGPAIYNTTYWPTVQNASVSTWYTMAKYDVQCYVLFWEFPENGTFMWPTTGPTPTAGSALTLLGVPGNLTWCNADGNISVELPRANLLATPWAWAVQIMNCVRPKSSKN